MKRLLYILFTVLTATSFFAQEDVTVSLNAGKNKIEIGEPIDVTLSIDYPVSMNTGQIVLPLVTDSAKLGEGIEVWDVQMPFDTIAETNNGDFIKHYEQKFTVSTFDTGLVDIKPVRAIFGTDTIYSNAVTLTVSATPLGEQPQLKDIKPIEEDPFSTWEKIRLWLINNWWWLTLLILLPFVIWGIVYYLKNKPEKEVVIKEIIPLDVRIYKKLEEIEGKKLWQNGKYKKYYSAITDTLRSYLAERYGVSTFEKTTSEIIEQLKLKPVPKDQLIQLEKLLRLADMVKFAKANPTKLENESAIEIAKEFVEKTYEKPQTPKTEE